MTRVVAAAAAVAALPLIAACQGPIEVAASTAVESCDVGQLRGDAARAADLAVKAAALDPQWDSLSASMSRLADLQAHRRNVWERMRAAAGPELRPSDTGWWARLLEEAGVTESEVQQLTAGRRTAWGTIQTECQRARDNLAATHPASTS